MPMKPATPGVGSLALSTSHHTCIHMVWQVFVGFRCSRAALRLIPDPGGKRSNFPSTPLTDIKRG